MNNNDLVPLAEKLIGLTPDEAKILCESLEVRCRTVTLDGHPQFATMDFVVGRMNLNVQNDKVIGVYVEGISHSAIGEN